MLPKDRKSAKLLGRVWRSKHSGPSIVIVKEDRLLDITHHFPTITDALNADLSALYDDLNGEDLGGIESFVHSPEAMCPDTSNNCLLAPCDLQAIKACGVTFAKSMVERVIDEQTQGDSERANVIRERIAETIGSNLSNLEAGSELASQVKETLIKEGLWSQYLEVGIGPDAEVFTKSQPMSAVGYGAEIGINPLSNWNNPEPEVVLAVNEKSVIRGATLGNDVNLRDVEGRSALLLGKAKDNNASCAIGPFIRLFDESFSLSDVANEEIALTIVGTQGFQLNGNSNMSEISRSPDNLVRQTINSNHQYPDGLMLFLGTMFAPTQDRYSEGGGFTHEYGDVVTISSQYLGELKNTVVSSDHAAPWRFGTRALMTSLAQRGLL
ncbi:fumarylacetoacetate hydrolase family protein [Vibrio sp. SCSIO 43132]|uniref:fumarylacetoacetate hydrolase family protein n=1 Tax=Vibrio sp. SCSIO 43132 TaxID=2779363 RepID=UPI001CA82EF8|nr:fumarylacetoacetate hydrolase family protein [Vibrio sp. SCSIO 43132]UAB71936.1 fumarylacetoacetate hydrolase family protein [Vibrio sp. SCSIO 43132]